MKKFFTLLFFSVCIFANATITITPATLPAGVLGHNYSATTNASGGTQPYTWTQSSGNMIRGVTFTSTGGTGTFSGYPTDTGTYVFTLRVVDKLNVSATKTYTVSVGINYLNNSQLTALWNHGQLPPTSGQYDTWYSVLNHSNGIPSYNSAIYTTSVVPTDTILVKSPSGIQYKTTYTGFNNLVGNKIISTSGTETESVIGNYQFKVNGSGQASKFRRNITASNGLTIDSLAGSYFMVTPDNTTNAYLLKDNSSVTYLQLNTNNGNEAMVFGSVITNPLYNFIGSGSVAIGGSLGVGTVTPGFKTDITAAAGDNTYLLGLWNSTNSAASYTGIRLDAPFSSRGGAGYGYVRMGSQAGAGTMDFGNSTNWTLRFLTADVERFNVNGGTGVVNFLTDIRPISITFSNTAINTTAGDAATINGSAGRFRKDASGSTFTLTNSFINANTIISLTFASDLGITGNQISVVAGSGSAVITFWTAGVAAAPAANQDVNFVIIN